ncbi:hypothetical protein BGZ97_008623, partial [Linnemannia gamsii]
RTMHFSTFRAFFIAFGLTFTTTTMISPVSAQVGLSDGCMNCLANTAPKISPYCTHDIVTRVSRVKNVDERKCFCPLANNSEWLNPCNRPGVCTNQEVNAAYGELFRMKKDVCTFGIPTAFTRPQAPAAPGPAPAPAPAPAPGPAPAPVPAPRQVLWSPRRQATALPRP